MSTSSWESLLTPQELLAYNQFFSLASRSKPGIVTGQEAVQFFATSGVPNQILSDIWETADRDNLGYLTRETFFIALKLIACSQHGKDVADPILSTVVPLPQFEGVKINLDSSQTASTAGDPATTITPAEREKYLSIFRIHQPVDGIMDGEKAKTIFLKSKLPAETLAQIWNLADVRQAGNLNQTEFVIAMHYIAKVMDSTITTLPSQLPPSVYATAGGTVQHSPALRPPPAVTASPPPRTPQQRSQTIDSLGSLAFSGASQQPAQWDVTAHEKAQYDAFFDKIDTRRSGFIQGSEAVEFFKNSRLPEVELAHIWDLADTKQQGRLTRDEFAVAMHLIHKRLRGEPLPNVLPPTLIPPSPHVMPVTPSPAFSAAAVPHSAPTNAAIQSPSATGASLLDDQDLLGDFGNNEQLTKETNQVNQLQNQMAALTTATREAKAQKLDAQQTLEQLAKQKQELQAQLAQVQMAHEAEMKDLRELQSQIENEKPGWLKAQQDYEAAQQQLAATQNEIAQLQQTLQNGRMESESLRQAVHEIQEETARLNAELENLRGQVKQQNMMLDINRRQVTASEQDRDQAKRDLADFRQERNLPESVGLPEEKQEESTEKSPDTTSNSKVDLFDIFSPKPGDDEAKAEPSKPASDFDSIFGGFDATSVTTQHTASTVSPFDPVGWATPPEKPVSSAAATPTARSARPAPPPPPPQSRHHRQSSESQPPPTPSATTGKKSRAPPPLPPTTNTSQQQQTPPDNTSSKADKPFDDFDAAFSGQLSDAQVVQSKPSDFDEFDEAFGVFDKDEKPSGEKKTTTTDNGLNWASSFGGFDFGGDSSSNSKRKDEDDWDSIFGGSSNAKNNTDADPASFIGFEDAFSSFDQPKKDQATMSSAAPAAQAPVADDNNDSKSQKGGDEAVKSTGNSNLDELIKMGFGQAEAKEALDRYDQDLEKASNFLLDQSSK